MPPKLLSDAFFFKAPFSSSVSLAFVRRVDAGGGTVTVEYAGHSDELQISRNKKKAFLEAVNAYLTGNASGNGGPHDA